MRFGTPALIALALIGATFSEASVTASLLRGGRGGGQTNSASTPVKLPNGIFCNFCPDDDNFKWPLDDDWAHWHRDLKDETAGSFPLSNVTINTDTTTLAVAIADSDADADTDRELTSTDKLKASAKAAHYEAHYLQHATSKQAKDEHKRALQAAAKQADKQASMLVDAVNAGDVDDHDRILKDKMLPNNIFCNFCPDDDNFKWPLDDDWAHWHRDLKANDEASANVNANNNNNNINGNHAKLSSTEKLKRTAKAAHYEAHYLQHAASKQVKDEHKRVLEGAAKQADKEAAMLIDAVKAGDIDDHDRILKEKKLPNEIFCNFCPDDDNFKWPLDDDWAHWHRDLSTGEDEKNNRSETPEGNDERKMKAAVKLPNGIFCNFCPDDDNFKWPLDDDWAHWH